MRTASLRDPMQRLLSWIDARFPLTKLWEDQWGKYIAPKNFNFWYYFGSLAGFVLVLQIVTGIFLAMTYKPDATKAFETIEYKMRDVPAGSVRMVGDPEKAVKVMLKVVDLEKPPLHLPLGARAFALARTKIAEFTADLDAWEAVAKATDYE